METLNISKELEEEQYFVNYLAVRDKVLKLIQQNKLEDPSSYWLEELAGFDYMLEATPLIVRKLREHCHHITGLRAYEYRKHHVKNRKAFQKKFDKLNLLDKSNLWIDESPALGGFGHKLSKGLANVDTLKFYETLIAMDHAGVLEPFKEDAGKERIALEIGGGWGGFGYQFKQLFPEVTYIIVDLPQTLLFSGTYLKSLFPHADIYIEDPTDNFEDFNLGEYDFLLISAPSAKRLVKRIDLAINMVSFQEMTDSQVFNYAQWLKTIETTKLYSHNRNRSKYNRDLSSVHDILAEFFSLEEIRVLEEQYTDISPNRTPWFKRLVSPRVHENRYRHIVGYPK